MNNWKELLADVDDDYLIGISNKGIVKRAYKDKDETAASVTSEGEEAQVQVGEETVKVRYPLGESKCSCPSRSICRHVVLAILVLKENCLKSAPEADAREEADGSNPAVGTVPGENPTAVDTVPGENPALATSTGINPVALGTASGDNPAADTAPGINPVALGTAPGENPAVDTAPGVKTPPPETTGENADGRPEPTGMKAAERPESTGKSEPAPDSTVQAEAPQENTSQTEAPHKSTRRKSEVTHDNAGQADAEAGTANHSASAKVLAEIAKFPLAQLKKVLGIRQLQTIHSQLRSGTKPQIQYSSIVTVRFPGQTTMVKLLSPLEYSSCTCHKKELCVHKAAAILWCQLEAGIVKEEDLAVQAVETPAFQMDRAREAAGWMKPFLEELLGTGLSRSSPDVLDYLERLAIISHNAGLAKFEGYFRSLSDSYDRYFQRKAAFCTEELMEQITRLYRRVTLLEAAIKSGDSGQVLKYAGEFRADYVPVGNLDLIGITMEQFQTQTGYEGETIYFLEENTGQWYTYTNARPMFYENTRGRRHMEKGSAPWGLGISIEDLAKVRIHLTGAKCDARKRLSSSQETRGEITGEQRLERELVKDWYYEDFGKLFTEQIAPPRKQWLYGSEEEQKGVELVFVQPAYVVKADFSQTDQQLSMPLYDKAGREIVIEMTYSKRESGAIRYLERISEREPSCFLGKIYLRDGKIRMYPVDVWKDLGTASGAV